LGQPATGAGTALYAMADGIAWEDSGSHFAARMSTFSLSLKLVFAVLNINLALQ
jgi:hypothetical protein